MAKLGRRTFTLGLGALLSGGCSRFSTHAGAPPASRLPPREDFLLRDGYLLTMDPSLGDLPRGSLLVRQGRIVEVGQDVSAPGVPVIDAEGMIVLPGLVDTHWHMWNTLLRGFAGAEASEGYFPTIATYGQHMTPGDFYQSTRLAAAEALASGITTVHDYCHNVRSVAHAEADLQALRDTGLRGRWSFGWAQGQAPDVGLDLGGLGQLHARWSELSPEKLATAFPSFASSSRLACGWACRWTPRCSPETPTSSR